MVMAEDSALGVTQICCIFRYQHVDIGKAKLCCWGSKPTPVPNANGFASQWNIGLSLIVYFITFIISKMFIYEKNLHKKIFKIEKRSRF